MKTALKKYMLNLSEQDYHNYPAWSYSIISKYAKEGFSAIATLHDKTEPTPSMQFGSLFDSILTKGKKTLDDYVVFEGEIPPAAEKKVLEYLAALPDTPENLNEVSDSLFETTTTVCEYYPKWGLTARIKHLLDYSTYYNVLKSKKSIVSKQDWEDAIEMAKTFRTNPYLNQLFGTSNTNDVEYIYQSQFVVDYTLPSGRVIKIKIMPDLLKINHKEKTIQPVDLKTSAIPAWNFKENFLKFRYDLQAKIYSDILIQIMQTDEELKDYIMLPYLFTDISRSDKVPVTFVYDQTSEEQANGFVVTISDKTYTYKSWQVLLDEILSYEEASALVPSYISTTQPNNILDIINYK